MYAVGFNGFFNLCGQFARGGENQYTRATGFAQLNRLS